jgi:DNA-binding MarR family transcriptional regulator
MTRAVTTPPTTAIDPTDVARLRLTIGRLYRQMVQASDRQDLTMSQVSALAKIDEHGPLRLGELAAREGVAGPTMIRTINSLVAGDLVRRAPDPTDGRSFLLSMTPAGTKLITQIRRDRTELLARRAARLTDAQRAALVAAVPVLELLLED